MPSIKDVAKLAHVSVSTVSNILNSKNNFSIDVYNRVMAAMDELNYSPNMLARNLRANKLLFVGVILPDLSGHYLKIYEGINRMACQHGFYLILKLSQHNRQLEQVYLDELVTLSVRGILLVTCHEENTDFFDHILARSIPIIFLERSVEHRDYTSICFEHEKLFCKLTADLLAKNPDQKIMLVTGPDTCSSERDAMVGFLAAYSNLRMEPPPGSMIHVTMTKESAFREIMNVLSKRSTLPEAYLVTSELVGSSLLEILALFHSKAQVCLLSGDDWHHFRLPANVTLIRQKAIEMGFKAVELLDQYIHSPLLFENRRITLQPGACVTSSGPAITRRQQGSLKILFLKGPAAAALINLMPNFPKSSQLDITWQQSRYTDLYDAIIDDFNHDEPQYDIFMIDLPWINQLVEKKCLRNLKDFVQRADDSFLSNYSPLIIEKSFNQNGNFYTAPIMIGFQILIYRKDLFEDQGLRWQFYETYGIPLQPPKTWTEFNLIARFFTRSFNPNSPVEYGTCIAGQHHVTIMQEFLPRQWSFYGKSVLDNGDVVIDSIQNVKTLQNLKESFACSPPESLGFFWDDQIRQFFQGKVAMINTFNSHIHRTTDASWNEVVNQIGYDDIPGNIPMLGGWVLGINRRSKSAEQAFQYIKWACSDQLAIHNTLLGGLVPKTCVIQNKELMLTYPWFEKMQNAPEKGRIGDLIRKRNGSLVDCFDLDKTMGESIIDVLLDRRNIPDTLKIIGQNIQKLL